MIESPLALVTVIAAATALAFWLDYRVPALGKVGASMLALIFGAILSNTGLVPVDSGVYEAVFGPVTSVAIAWLLLSVNLRDLRKAGPRMVGAFGVAVTGTVLGAFVAAAVYGVHFGEDTMRMAWNEVRETWLGEGMEDPRSAAWLVAMRKVAHSYETTGL